MKKRNKYKDISPDDIFLDSENLSNLNKQQFEGVLEKPVSKQILFIMSMFFLFFGIVFIGRVGYVQIVRGETFYEKSENNRLDAITIFSERGVIYDKNGTELAWNEPSDAGEPFLERRIIDKPGFSHLLGYIAYPKKDKNGNYWRAEIIGESGVEEIYNDLIAGENGEKLIEIDATLNPQSENLIKMPEDGQNLVLTVDSDVQAALYAGIANVAKNFNFQGGAGIIMDVRNGDILAITSYPEFSVDAMADGEVETIQSYLRDSRKPFLNRAVAGLYTPGSTIKPFLAVAALEEGIIDDKTTIMSTGQIEVPNRFFPDQKSIFRDWRREGHGMTDIYWAIADSVNTFFYAIGGGYGNQEGLGINKIDEYLEKFKIGVETGIIFPGELSGTVPSPDWKEDIFGERWYLGDTYITSIGQFGLQTSLPQMVRGMAAIANGGTLYTPRITERDSNNASGINVNDENLAIVRKALRDTVTRGTAQILNISNPKIAAKTGTAQVGVDNEFFNSWSVGFFPYDELQYAFAVVMERGPEGGGGSASQALRYMFDRLNENEEFEW